MNQRPCRSYVQSCDAIAERRALKLTTSYTYLAQGIEEGELELAEAVSLTPEEVRAIERAFRHGMQEAPFALKPVFDAFDGQYD